MRKLKLSISADPKMIGTWMSHAGFMHSQETQPQAAPEAERKRKKTADTYAI